MAPSRSQVKKRKDIIDRKALVAALDDLAGWEGYSNRTRPKVLALFKQAMAAGEAEIRRRFEAGEATGNDTVTARSYLIDQIVRTLHDFAENHAYPVANPSTAERIAVVATGGYGRGKLAPHSDIDLLFLMPYRRTPHVEQVVEFMLYLLWDLSLKVGHATRSIDECIRLAQKDQTIQTALLDASWLWGEQPLFEAFKTRFAAEVIAGSGRQFVEAKLAERDQRHERMGDSRYVLEPNIKEGKGGLRDLQTLFWIATYLYGVGSVRELVAKGVLTDQDARRFSRAENFLWTVRCHLHYVAGRPEERLTFDVQTVLTERMHYGDRPGSLGVERFMKHYFLVAKEVGDLTRVLCAVLEENHKKKPSSLNLFRLARLRRRIPGFKVDGDRVMVEDDAAFDQDPIKILRLFREAQVHRLDIHPHALRLVDRSLGRIDRRLRADPAANGIFIEMLTSPDDPETTLRRLNEAGVFGRFIPDFGRVVAQMQYDMYHVYTVDEHTIRAIGVLHGIEKGRYAAEMPVVTEAVHEVSSRRALYVAVLLHDIAKGRGGDHSELGAEVALKLCPRLGLTPEETETVAWLIRHHLLMSRTAFKRNLEDIAAIQDFCAKVQSLERLRMLTVLTASDIRAVGPGVWNNWKAGLIRNLYFKARDHLSGGLSVEERDVRIERVKTALTQRLKDWGQDEIAHHMDLGQAAYWLSFDLDDLARHAEIVREGEKIGQDLHIDTRPDPSRDVTDITVYTTDHAGLFSQIAGAMALSGANIVDARVVTLTNGMALDRFSIQDAQGGPFDDPRALKSLWTRIEDAVRGIMRPSAEIAAAKDRALPSRTEVFAVAPRVLVDNGASRTHTVIEVNGRDRLGFLHDVTAALTGLGLQISSARISTYGERAVDVFYVKDLFGLKVDSEDKIKRIREVIATALAGSPAQKDETAA